MLTHTNNSEVVSALSGRERSRYSRHIMLPDVGMAGQERLKAARVAFVGAGGLGSPTILYLAAAGVGHITIIDDDVVDETNLQRQIIHDEDGVGMPKVQSAARAVRALNSDVHISEVAVRLTPENALELFDGHDLVIDGTDSFASRYLVSDACAQLGIPDVWASVFQFDGQLATWWAGRGPCYRCVFPNPPQPGMVPSCSEGGVFGALCGVMGASQATEALRILLGIGEPHLGRIALFDGMSGEWDSVVVEANPECAACGSGSDPVALESLADTCSISVDELSDDQVVTADELAGLLEDNPPGLRLVDLRGPDERAIVSIPGAEAIHLSEFEDGSAHAKLSQADDLVLYCKSGARSTAALRLMPSGLVRRVRHLDGGVLAWVEQVDPELARY